MVCSNQYNVQQLG